MIRILILVGLDFKRISRSRPSIVAALIVPTAGVAAHILAGENRIGAAISCFFPAAALLLAVVLLYVRGLVDRASGFAGGLESTPAAGLIRYGSKLATCIILALLQTAVFYAVNRIVA